MNEEFVNGEMLDQDDEFISYVEFESEDGDSLVLQVIDYFEYENETYGILVNADEEDDPEAEDMELCVLRLTETDEGMEFVEPDEALIPELQQIVEKIMEEKFLEYDDCGCGCGEHHHHDDCGCGEHHHHCDCGCEE